LDTGRVELSTNSRLCIRALRPGPFRLQVGIGGLVDTETACSAKYFPEARTDSSCGNGGVGELSKVLRLGGEADPVVGGSCAGRIGAKSFPALDLDHGGASVKLCDISQNEVVTFAPTISLDQAADSALLSSAQSDQAQFTYVFTLEQ
jgi:hypothetical protein